MRYLTPEQNARAAGRECAIERSGPKSREVLDKWRDIYRTTIVRCYESGRDCSVCQAGKPREEFERLLAEWDRGFNAAAGLILGSPAERAAEVKRIAGCACALAKLLEETSVDRDEARLRACADIADDVVSDLDVLLGGEG